MVKQAYDYDLLVIGAGAAGSTAASTAAPVRVGVPSCDRRGVLQCVHAATRRRARRYTAL